MLRRQPESGPDSEPTALDARDARRQPVQEPTSAADERQLLEYVRLLWSRRVLLAILTLVGGAAGLAVGLFATRAYEAQLILGVSQSKLDQDGQEQPAAVLLGNFRSILTSQAIARTIVTKFSLDEPPHELSPVRFLVRSVTVENIPSTTLLDVRVRLADPELAATVANEMAVRSVEISRGLTTEEAVQARDAIAAQLKESRQNLDTIARQLEDARKKAQVELKEKDITTILDQRAELRELIVEIAGERAGLAKAEQELAKRQRVETLSRSFDADPALAEASRSAGVANILGLTLNDQEVNPTYDKLDEEAALSRVRLMGLEQKRAQLAKSLNLDESTLPLLSRLYESERQIARLETDLEIARTVYVDVATRYEQARVQVASRSAQLLVVDPAVPPTLPVPRHLLRNVVLGAVAGLFVAILFILMSQAIATVPRASPGQPTATS